MRKLYKKVICFFMGHRFKHFEMDNGNYFKIPLAMVECMDCGKNYKQWTCEF